MYTIFYLINNDSSCTDSFISTDFVVAPPAVVYKHSTDTLRLEWDFTALQFTREPSRYQFRIRTPEDDWILFESVHRRSNYPNVRIRPSYSYAHSPNVLTVVVVGFMRHDFGTYGVRIEFLEPINGIRINCTYLTDVVMLSK